MAQLDIKPLECHVDEAVLTDLNARLDRTRWPDQPEGAGWDYGTELGYLQALCSHWRNNFDWRAVEQRLNSYPQFITNVDGERLHFMHIRSPEPNALPLIITHGWPGSVMEFLDVIDPLTNPVAHGGSPEDAFHLILPSIPGYGYSGPTRTRGFDTRRAAGANTALMAALGYTRYVAQGGDWGSPITSWMAIDDHAHVAAIHLNLIDGSPEDPADPCRGLSETDADYVRWKADYVPKESGYQLIQSTKPQSLSYGLTDSPAGLAGWIVEKFRTWTDCNGDIETLFSKDKLLENIMLYWVSGTINSANRMYYESLGPSRASALPVEVRTPTGHSRFPKEIRRTPRIWAERQYNVVYWNELPKGGHFAALEQPQLFVQEMRSFFNAFR